MPFNSNLDPTKTPLKIGGRDEVITQMAIEAGLLRPEQLIPPSPEDAELQRAEAMHRFEQGQADALQRAEARRAEAESRINQQFDPFIEMHQKATMRDRMMPGDKNPSMLGDMLHNVFGNMLTSHDGIARKSAGQARLERQDMAERQANNALAQMRQLMEGKSRAVDRLDQNTQREFNTHLQTLTAAMRQSDLNFYRERRAKVQEYNSGMRLLSILLSLDRNYEQDLGLEIQDLMFVKNRLDNEFGGENNYSTKDPHVLEKIPEIIREFRERSMPAQVRTHTIRNADGVTEVVKTRVHVKDTGQTSGNTIHQGPVDNSDVIPRKGEIPTSAPSTPTNRDLRTPLEINGSDVPHKPTAGDSFWAPGVENIPRLHRPMNIQGRNYTDKDRARIDTLTSAGKQLNPALLALASLSERGRMDLVGPKAPGMFAENMAQIASNVASVVTRGDIQPGAGFNASTQARKVFDSFEEVDRDVERYAIGIQKHLNAYIKEITGAAASIPEFLRIASAEATLSKGVRQNSELIYGYAVVAAHSLLNEGLFSDNLANRAYRVHVPEPVLNSFGMAFSQYMADATVEGRITKETIRHATDATKLAQALVAYQTALERGGEEKGREVLRGILKSFEKTFRSDNAVNNDLLKEMERRSKGGKTKPLGDL